MTPVEERIDRAKGIAERFEASASRTSPPFYPDPTDTVTLARAYLALLTEHSAYRELKAYARDALTILENAHYPPFDQETSPDAIAVIEGLRAALPATESAQRITHGRHCSCSACAAQDWTIGEPKLAPCGMHGPECPDEYQPLGRAGESAQPEEER